MLVPRYAVVSMLGLLLLLAEQRRSVAAEEATKEVPKGSMLEAAPWETGTVSLLERIEQRCIELTKAVRQQIDEVKQVLTATWVYRQCVRLSRDKKFTGQIKGLAVTVVVLFGVILNSAFTGRPSGT